MGRDCRRVSSLHHQDTVGAGLVYRCVYTMQAVSLGRATDCGLVAYTLGIYLLNIFLAFISPKFDPSLEQDEGMEDGTSGLPTKQDDEFRPFVRRLPEFKFWYSATRAIVIAILCSFFTVFDLPVFWPVLVVYWFILFVLTSKLRALDTSADCF